MSPIVVIVFAPVVIGGVAFFALLLGAATAGVWETAEGRQGRRAGAARRVVVNAAAFEEPRSIAA